MCVYYDTTLKRQIKLPSPSLPNLLPTNILHRQICARPTRRVVRHASSTQLELQWVVGAGLRPRPRVMYLVPLLLHRILKEAVNEVSMAATETTIGDKLVF